MRIGLDAHILGKGKGGVERVIHQMVALLPQLLPEDEFVVFTHRKFESPFPRRGNVQYHKLPVSDPIIQRSVVLPWLARRARLDVLHVQRAAPPRTRSKLIVHTHDLLPLTAPGDHRGWRDQVVRRLTPGSLRRADLVLTVSQTVAKEISELFPEVAGKVAAVLNGIDGEKFRVNSGDAVRPPALSALAAEDSYILYLGALMSRKNLLVAIEGYARFVGIWRKANSRPVPHFVLAGMSRSEDYEAELRKLSERLAPGLVHFLGFVTEGDCVRLLQQARLFLAPSRGEGFDLPALEAMACGVPVICSEIEVHRELLADDALYFSPLSPDELARCIAQITGDPTLAARLKAAGLARAALFSWERSMRQLAKLYRSLH